MTPRQQKAALDGQSSIARKVFEIVPIQEAWSPHVMISTLHDITRSSIDMHTFKGCLGALREAGLVRETSKGFYQRIAVHEKDESMRATPETSPAPAPQKPALALPKSPIDVLGGIAQRLTIVRNSLNEIISDIETAALATEETLSEHRESADKLRQLQHILKGTV
jgi:hypothetical protein